MARYIHHNPVDAGIVRDISQYRWSSHRGYLDKKRCPDWLDTEILLARFEKGSRGVKEYESFMRSGVEKEMREFYRERFQRPILGAKHLSNG